jgi:hypothetical protein
MDDHRVVLGYHLDLSLIQPDAVYELYVGTQDA